MKSNQPCTIYLVRHGETEWNVKRLIQGHGDSPLTKLGIKQASNTAEKLKNVHFDQVFSSDLSRARDTAEIIAQERNLAIKMTEFLREKAFGDYEGREYDIFRTELKEYSENFAQLTSREKWNFKYPTIETDAEVIERLIRFLREVALAYHGRNVLVVSHAGIIGLLLIHLGVWDYSDQHTKKIGNASYLKLESDGIDFFVKEAEGIDIS